MSVRVIAGLAKGRKLKSVPGDSTRPVMDRVKAAIFNILAGDVIDSIWWDLFAGTGAIGIEALSRGAAFVRFTDVNRAAVDTIRQNLEHCRFKASSEIRRGDSLALLAQIPDRRFDFIYIAPPQYMGIWVKALKNVDEFNDWLSDRGTVMVQIDPKEFHEPELACLEETDRRKYGNTLVLFYDRKSRP